MSSAADPAACGPARAEAAAPSAPATAGPTPSGAATLASSTSQAHLVLGAHGGGSLHRQAGLARPARAGQCHESAGADRLAHLFQLGTAADETAQPLPQIACCRRSRGRPGRSRAGCAERRILGQDPGLEFPQGQAGVDAQLVDQAITDFGVGAQGLGLPSGPVQGQDEQLPQALAQRVLPTQLFQFAGQLPVAAQHQVRFGTGLDRDQAQLVQMRPLGVGEAGIGELGQRLPPPQAKRLAQRGRRQRHLALLNQAPSFRHQLLKADDVDLIGTDGEGIASFGGNDRAGPEGAAQLADLGLQRVGRVRRLPAAPQHVDQAVSADRLATMQRQQGQQGPLLGPAHSERHAPVRRLELAEQPHIHCLHPTALIRCSFRSSLGSPSW